MAEQVQRILNLPSLVHHWQDGRIDGRELVIDLLTEVRHFAHDHAVDFESALDMSHENFVEEVER
jgi:hypothetical protein